MNESKKLRGTEKISQLLEDFPEAADIIKQLGIADINSSLTLVELARENHLPLQVLLNHLGKKLGLEVEWPKISGQEGKNFFGASTSLREGKPTGVKQILAVHSGKGGVGKTFLSIGLAQALANSGKKVGLLDLDIDCPNIPKILGLEGKLITTAGKKIAPKIWNGLKVVSMGNIQESENSATMWRGPILTKAIEQLIHDTEWGELDILVADLPPGTGDIPLTLFNLVRPEQVVIVATPQETALTDAAKAIDLAKKLGVKIAGIVENMTGEIFGNSHGPEFFRDWEINYLGEIELKSQYSKNSLWKQQNQELNQVLEKICKKILFS